MSIEQEILQLSKLKENRTCFDCGCSNNDWCNINYAIFLCIDCAGKHRAHGVYYSKIKHIEIDKWDSLLLKRMEIGGNRRLQKYLKKNSIERGDAFYKSDVGLLYKNQLNKELNITEKTINVESQTADFAKEKRGSTFVYSIGKKTEEEPVQGDYRAKLNYYTKKALDLLKLGGKHAREKGQYVYRKTKEKIYGSSAQRDVNYNFMDKKKTTEGNWE